MPRRVYGLFNCAVSLNIHSKVIFRETAFQSTTSKHTDRLVFFIDHYGGDYCNLWTEISFLTCEEFPSLYLFLDILGNIPITSSSDYNCSMLYIAHIVYFIFSSILIDRDHFQLGTLSHTLNNKATGYLELSNWPEVAPDPSVRNVEVIELVS